MTHPGDAYERSSFKIGDTIDGRYLVLAELNRGGMGVLYRVRQIFLDKEVVLKTIEKSNINELVIRRFQQEAKMACSLNHPNVVTVHDFGLLHFDSEIPYLTMEFLKGETLSERLKRVGALPVDEALLIFNQVCLGLAYAHDCGVVHRDIKPSNIMLRSDCTIDTEGAIKILDFGIAKSISFETGDALALTRPGEVLGSPLYMSPEQCNGESVDHRADVYALGCVIFETLTGAPPCIGDSALTTMMKHQKEVPPALSQASLGVEFSKPLEQVVAKMLAKDPNDRYQNLYSAANDLSAIRRGEYSVEETSSPRIKGVRGSETVTLSKNSLYFLIGCICSLLAIAVGFGIYSSGLLHSHQEVAGSDVFKAKDSTPETAEKLRGKSQDVLSPKTFSVESLADAIDYQRIPENQYERMLVPDADGAVTLQNKLLSQQEFDFLATQTRLKNLSIKGCELSNEALGALSQLPRLTYMNVNTSSLNDVGAEEISRLNHLDVICTRETSVSDSGVKYFTRLKDIKSCDVSKTLISDKAVAFLNWPKLQLLTLRGDKIGDSGVAQIHSPLITSLDLSNTQITDVSLRTLATLTNLAILKLNGTRITGAALSVFCKTNKCKEIEVRQCPNLDSESLKLLRATYPDRKFTIVDSESVLDN